MVKVTITIMPSRGSKIAKAILPLWRLPYHGSDGAMLVIHRVRASKMPPIAATKAATQFGSS